MRRLFLGLQFLFLACFLMVSPLTALGADPVRGVTDTEILIGQWGPQTGPAALWGAVARGTGVYFDLVNEEGGIHGRKIKYFLRDDGYQPAKTKAIAKEFVESLGIFGVASGVGTSTGMAARDYLMENKVPWVGPSTGSKHWSQPLQKYLFAVYPLYSNEAFLLTQYVVEKLGKKKVAIFYQNDDYGKEGMEGVREYADKSGMKLVAEVPVEVTDSDLKSHALKLKESGADAVILWILPKHAAMILQQAKAVGYEPQWVASSTLSDAPLMFKLTKGLWDGVVFANFLNIDTPLAKKYLEAQKKYAPSEQNPGIFFLAGFVFVEPMVEGLKRAGRDLNPETFVKAMETIRNWNDWLGYDCTFTSEDHQGMKSVFLSKCGPDGNPIKISDWVTYKGK